MSPSYTLDVNGSIRAKENLIVSTNNTTGGGIIFADDGDIVDLNDAFCTMRFTSGIRITNANRGGGVVHELNANGKLYNYGLYHYSYGSYDYLLTSNGSARHITSLPYLPYSGWWNSGSGQNVDDANGMTFVYGDHGSPNGWGILCTFDYTYNSGYKFQLFAEGYSAAGMYYRCRSSDRGGWTNWKTVIDSGNIGSQSVSYASSAGSVAWSNVTSKPFGGTTFYSGNSSNAEHNCNNATANGHYYYTSNGPSGIGNSTSDGALYVQSYSDSWVGQIAQDYRNGRLFVRGKNNGSWTNWLNVLDSSNYSSFVLPLSGGTMTGLLTTTSGGNHNR